MYKISSVSRPPQKRPTFGEAFRQSFGGALGNALVNIPANIGIGAASGAIEDRLGLHYGEGGKGWRANRPPDEVARYDALQALLEPEKIGEMALTTAQTGETEKRGGYYETLAEGELQDIVHSELMFPSVFSGAMTGSERAEYLLKLLKAGKSNVQIDQGVITFQDPAVGGRRLAGMVVPKSAPRQVSSNDRARSIFAKMQKLGKDLREARTETKTVGGVTTTVSVTPETLARKNRLTMAKLLNYADDLEAIDPVAAQKYLVYVMGGERFVVPGMTLADGIEASGGIAERARSKDTEDITKYEEGRPGAKKSKVPKLQSVEPPETPRKTESINLTTNRADRLAANILEELRRLTGRETFGDFTAAEKAEYREKIDPYLKGLGDRLDAMNRQLEAMGQIPLTNPLRYLK